MGRSVATHSGSVETVYLHLNFQESYEWDDFLDDVRNVLQDRFKSLEDCEVWEYRECHGILENQHARIFVSEYCGVVAIDLVPRDENDWNGPSPLAEQWCASISKNFDKILTKAYSDSAMVRVGGFSNGESVYQAIAA